MKQLGTVTGTAFFVVLLFVCQLYARDTKGLDEMGLDDLMQVKVITASKRSELLSNAHGVVTVITADEIKMMGARNLGDVLHNAPGIQVVGARMFPNCKAAIRGDITGLGYVDRHTLVLINGKPFRDGVEGGHNNTIYGTFPLSVIERLEIIRGPGSVLYGSNAYTGVINIITKSLDKLKHTELGLGANSNKGITQNGLIAIGNQEYQSIFSQRFLKEEGWEYAVKGDTAFNPTEPVNRMDMSGEYFSIFNQTYVKGIRVNTFFSRGFYKTPQFWPNEAIMGHSIYKRLFLNLEYELDLASSWNLNVNGTWNFYDLEMYMSERVNLQKDKPEEAVQFSGHQASDYVLESYLSGRILDKFNMMFGGLVYTLSRNKLKEPSSVQTPYQLDRYSAYYQFDTKLWDRLNLIIGGQVNKPAGEDVDFVPRYGINYNISSKMGVKLHYGEAFRSPFPSELFASFDWATGSLDQKPEKIKTFDAQYYFTIPKFMIATTYFMSQYNDLIVFSSILNRPDNLDKKITAYGGEIEVKYNPTANMKIFGSAMYQIHEEDASFAPNEMGKFGFLYRTPFNLSMGLTGNFYGTPEKWDKITDDLPETKTLQFEDQKPEAYYGLDLNLFYTVPVKKDVEVALFFKNLLDQEYTVPDLHIRRRDAVPMDGGFSVTGEVKVGF